MFFNQRDYMFERVEAIADFKKLDTNYGKT